MLYCSWYNILAELQDDSRQLPEVSQTVQLCPDLNKERTAKSWIENNIQAEQWVSKFLPAVEDAYKDTEDDTNRGFLLDSHDKLIKNNDSAAVEFSSNKIPDLGSNRDTLEAPPCDHSDSNQPHEESVGRPSSSLGYQNELRHKRESLALESGSDESYPPRSGIGQSGEEIIRYNGTLEDRADSLSLEGASSRSKDGAPLKNQVSLTSDDDNWKCPVSYHFELCNLPLKKKEEVERKASHILHSSLPEFMDKHTESWKSTGFWRSTSNAVPRNQLHFATNSEGFPEWRYDETQREDGETHYLRYRLAHIKLFLAYVREFDRLKKPGVPGQTAKRRAVEIICGTKPLPKGVANKIRMAFHDRKLIGESWWWCGHYFGRGFILSCSQETGFKM
ncbi:hypothetical protein N7490_006285 [Penicillium lividum]|nr:hypothetical protein N7490_006285 [Penicillium lividum]